MSGPDVRWEGVPHKQILDWVNQGPGPKLTERMEARLKSVAKTLIETSDLVNTTLQRVNGGEWSGTAASTAAAAMQVLRDFDDTMHHRSIVSDITAFGQSDSANWARANVPPEVDKGPASVPLGDPGDVLRNTEDYQDLQVARREAEQRARQVMQEYTTMTVDRVQSMPPLAPAPQVVLDATDSGGSGEVPGPGGGSDADGGLGGGSGADGGDGGPGGSGADGGSGGAGGSGGSGAGSGNGVGTGGAESPQATAPALAPSAVGARSPAGIAQVGSAPEAAGGAGLPVGATVPLDAVAGPLGSARPGAGGLGGAGGDRAGAGHGGPRGRGSGLGGRAGEPGWAGTGRGEPGGRAGELGGRAGEPGGRAGEPGWAGTGRGEPGGRGSGLGGRAGEPGGRVTEPGARAAQQSTNPRAAAPAGVAPVGPPLSRDERDRQSRYTVPSSAIFQPDEDDGRLRDPYQAGAHVAPPAIGAEDE